MAKRVTLVTLDTSKLHQVLRMIRGEARGEARDTRDTDTSKLLHQVLRMRVTLVHEA